MQSRPFFKVVGIIIGVGIITWLLFGFFGIQALFTNRIVNEAIPQPTPNPRVVAHGAFQQGDSTYAISGKAIITETQGSRTLSLTDFDVTNGPDLFVYAVSAPSVDNTAVKDAVSAGSFVNLAVLKGNRGNQNYTIPAEVTIDENTVISIWCRRFSRNFGSAELEIVKS